MTIGERIKIILLFKKMSQRQFAKSTKMSESQLSKVLNSKKRLSLKELKTIVEVLNIPYDCLVGNVSMFDDLLSFYMKSEKDYLWNF